MVGSVRATNALRLSPTVASSLAPSSNHERGFMRALTVTAALLLVACNGTQRRDVQPTTPRETEAASALLRRARGVFPGARSGTARVMALPASTAAFSLRGDELAVRTSGHVGAARVAFAARASGGFSVEDPSSGAAVRVVAVGANDAPAELADGYVVYRAATSTHADILQRPSAAGTEDYLVVRAAPDVAEIRYSIELGDAVAGLRLMGDSLELLDAGGAPRLRMAPPHLVDAAGSVVRMHTSVTGCAFDADPRGPWGRPVTPPGSRACALTVTWARAAPRYPVLVDPSWALTGSPAVAHGSPLHVLPNGLVLAASQTVSVFAMQCGNYHFDASDIVPQLIDTVELYDPSSRTWSATQDTPVPMGTTALLPDGRVLRVGTNELLSPASGADCTVPYLTAIYDPASATWSATAPMITGRISPSLVTLVDGRVFAFGGFGSFTDSSHVDCLYPPNIDAEFFDPAHETWSLAPAPLATPSVPGWIGGDPTLLLKDGRVLLGNYTFDFQIFDPVANQWSDTGIATGFDSFEGGSIVDPPMAMLPDGRVVMAGGVTTTPDCQEPDGGGTNLAFLFDSTTLQRTPLPAVDRAVLLAFTGSDGLPVVLYPGGVLGPYVLDASLSAWTDVPPALPALSRYDPNATVALPDRGRRDAITLHQEAVIYSPGSGAGTDHGFEQRRRERVDRKSAARAPLQGSAARPPPRASAVRPVWAAPRARAVGARREARVRPPPASRRRARPSPPRPPGPRPRRPGRRRRTRRGRRPRTHPRAQAARAGAAARATAAAARCPMAEGPRGAVPPRSSSSCGSRGGAAPSARAAGEPSSVKVGAILARAAGCSSISWRDSRSLTYDEPSPPFLGLTRDRRRRGRCVQQRPRYERHRRLHRLRRRGRRQGHDRGRDEQLDVRGRVRRRAARRRRPRRRLYERRLRRRRRRRSSGGVRRRRGRGGRAVRRRQLDPRRRLLRRLPDRAWLYVPDSWHAVHLERDAGVRRRHH